MVEIMTNQPGRPEGLPKTGGRAKGTPNKKSVELRERCEALNGGKSLVETLIQWAQEEYDEGDRKEAAGIMGKALPYVYPQLKAVELSGSVAHELPLPIEQGEEPTE
jgi:hypothetical protein